MTEPGGGGAEPGEVRRLSASINEIAERLTRMEEKLDQRFVPRELYEARHTALRSEVALELAAIKARQDADRLSLQGELANDRKTAETAKTLAMWAVGLIAAATIVALVGFLQTGGT